MQFEWNSKDSISFGIYNEVVEQNKAEFFIWLESNNKEVNLTDIRTGNPEYRFNSFIIKEDNLNNTILICPNIAGCPAYFRIKSNDSFHMIIIRKDGTIESDLVFRAGETKLELIPAGIRMYKVNVEGMLSSDQENDSKSISESDSPQQEVVPEFFGGSYSSAPVQAPISPASNVSEVSDNPIDDANIFVGGFNSESDSVSETPLFADMFPGTTPGTPNFDNTNTQAQQENVETQPIGQNNESGFSPFNFHQDAPAENRTSESGHISGFSVPYVETEGIRERRDRVQNLQQDNDRTVQEVEELERRIAELQNRSRQLSDSKSSLISLLETLQHEYDKDYSKFQTDIDEIKGRYTVDQSILEYYKDRDLVPIEDLLRQTNELVQKVEEQIRLFVTAQQNKSDEIEKALKVGKKE